MLADASSPSGSPSWAAPSAAVVDPAAPPPQQPMGEVVAITESEPLVVASVVQPEPVVVASVAPQMPGGPEFINSYSGRPPNGGCYLLGEGTQGWGYYLVGSASGDALALHLIRAEPRGGRVASTPRPRRGIVLRGSSAVSSRRVAHRR